MKETKNSLFNLIGYAKPNKSKIIFASLCSMFNKICDIVPEILIGLSIDVIVNQQHSIIAKLGIKNPYSQLYLIGALTAILWVLESVFEYLYSITWRDLAQNIQHNLRLKTYSHIQEADLSFFEDKTTGGLLNIVQDDINQLEQFLSQVPNEVIQLIVNILAMGIIFLYLSPTLALLAILPIPFVIAIAYYFKNKIAYSYTILRQAASSLASHIAYRLQGIMTIKSYTTESYELYKLNKESDIYQKAHHEASRLNAKYVPTVRMAVMVGFIVSLVVGGIYALQGQIPINWYASLVFLTQRFLWPFTILSTITDMYEKSLVCASRINSLLTIKPTIYGGQIHLDIESVNGEIKFENVCFSYSNGLKIFNNLTLQIPAKKTVAFVGGTGSGKSTIIKMLLRFYDSSKGKITIDGIDIKKINIKDLRAAIALVSQDIYLVDGTISDNIDYAKNNSTHEDIIKAAQIAQSHEFIMDLPEQYDTKIQEHGKNLSGGQRQRISIARAILKKSPILIFDEATSAIDNETEALIQKSINKLAEEHTIIIIAHRLTTVRNADIIFVLDKGQIVESGSHDELLKLNRAYSKLWNTQ